MPFKTATGELATLTDWVSRLERCPPGELPALEVPVLVAGVPATEDFEAPTQVAGTAHSIFRVPRSADQCVIIPLVRKTLVGSQSGLSLGRAPICDVVVPFAPVSKVHATVKYEQGQWMIADVGSTNGTRVGIDSLMRNVWQVLTDGDVVNFGALCTRFWLPSSFIQSLAVVPSPHTSADS